ncbi:hypothetical protein U9M48_022767 [Paspalum notatum var. saurae]|uniref:Reverse transcriptase domain-containing protein n=1 Tax=Paspalum notatum var. saurae TaxID=547442 RepID=A0AAQ3WV16_PASNO
MASREFFFSKCWDTIKADIQNAANTFHLLRASNLAILNSANIVLVPKKEGAMSVADYRPISLISLLRKNHFQAPLMSSLVSPNQSAFIKGRSIHDNFLSVHNTIRHLHGNKTLALFIKLDITKAFDSELGFPTRWCDWIAALLSTSLSRVLLNGVPSALIKHGRGLLQGDPLSPLLFIIAIDPLQKLLDLATNMGCLGKLYGKTATLRASMYADDAAIFIKPTCKDVSSLVRLLENFGDTSGLLANARKSTIVPIRCEALDLAHILANFEAQKTIFPIKYLGLLLSHKRLKRIDF